MNRFPAGLKSSSPLLKQEAATKFGARTPKPVPFTSPYDRNLQLLTFPQLNGLGKINRRLILALLQTNRDLSRPYLRRRARSWRG